MTTEMRLEWLEKELETRFGIKDVTWRSTHVGRDWWTKVGDMMVMIYDDSAIWCTMMPLPNFDEVFRMCNDYREHFRNVSFEGVQWKDQAHERIGADEADSIHRKRENEDNASLHTMRERFIANELRNYAPVTPEYAVRWRYPQVDLARFVYGAAAFYLRAGGECAVVGDGPDAEVLQRVAAAYENASIREIRSFYKLNRVTESVQTMSVSS